LSRPGAYGRVLSSLIPITARPVGKSMWPRFPSSPNALDPVASLTLPMTPNMSSRSPITLISLNYSCHTATAHLLAYESPQCQFLNKLCRMRTARSWSTMSPGSSDARRLLSWPCLVPCVLLPCIGSKSSHKGLSYERRVGPIAVSKCATIVETQAVHQKKLLDGASYWILEIGASLSEMVMVFFAFVPWSL
jgi:hypothetical protein